ncbi:ensconsin-like isoform X2 [Coccinella septempunctata]|uniref:ensconsin-like isoform X2 n=1 Tax=Coccinella septempunctata TaxID=41139 RepID=UPI001D087DA8|nr:ensconsin-like isoform X2 [Coccinella septempunctata]
MSEKSETPTKQLKPKDCHPFEDEQNTVDKDVRLKIVKEKQNEERQRKLEEIKAQAFAAQRFKEQKEQERRQRLEEMRIKEEIRRQQVEERKKAINEAERDRLESILRRNQQRENRLETKRRNERSSLVFAFGSSTPRNLDPNDLSSSFWGHRRATSTQNITTYSNSSLTRRGTERDIENGTKKRATSAGGLERAGESSLPTTPAGCASGYLGRRRTDLMPTIPSRDSLSNSSRKSLSHSPGRAYSMTRLDQLAKPRQRPDLPALNESDSSFRPLSHRTHHQSSVTRSMSHLAVSKARQPVQLQQRKSLNKSDSRSMDQLSYGPVIMPRTTRASQLRQGKLQASSNSSDASSRPSSSMSHQSTTSVTSSVSVRHRPSSGPRKPRPASIAITGVSANQDKKLDLTKPPLPKRKSITKSTEKVSKSKPSTGENTPKPLVSPTATEIISVIERKVNGEAHKKPPDAAQAPEAQHTAEAASVEPRPAQEVATDDLLNLDSDKNVSAPAQQTEIEIKTSIPLENITETDSNGTQAQTVETNVNKSENLPQVVDTKVTDNKIASEKTVNNVDATLTTSLVENRETTVTQSKEMTSSVNNELSINKDMSSSQISNEMTASQIKAIISTEEEAKAAIAERRRLAKEEAARRAEQERLRVEAEQKAELERQRQEEEQVRLLIEAQRAAEEQRLNEAIQEAKRREEEEQRRKEEEARLKALREEADRKARLEAEKQKAEQQERLIKEEKEREARRKRVEAIMLRTRGKQNTNSQQNSEESSENKSENKVNGTKPLIEEQNGPNVVKEERVDNIIQEDAVKNANSVSIETINNSTDSMNSNNLWQSTTQPYGNFVLNNNS